MLQYFGGGNPDHPVRQPENGVQKHEKDEVVLKQIRVRSGTADKAYRHLQRAKAAV